MKHSVPFFLLLLVFSLYTPIATAQTSEPSLHLGIERVVGYSNSSIDTDGGGGSVSFLNFGSFTVNPLASPRIGIDYLSSMGVTLGVGVGYAAGSVTDDDSNGEVSLSLYSFTPRLGYRAKIDPMFDLIPRIGLTLLGGSITGENGNSCKIDIYDDCSSYVEKDESSFSATVLSAEAVGVLRLTSSFNLIGGLAVEPLMSASGKQKNYDSDPEYGSSSDSESFDGSIMTLSLWFGISGYL